MKKILLSLFCLTLLFAACNNDDLLTTDQTNPGSPQDVTHFSGVKLPEGSSTRGIALGKKLWNANAAIDIKFLNGSPEFQEKVKTYASEWLNYAGVKFNFVTATEDEADVRIAFDSDGKWVTWSYTGTDCKYERDQSKPTVNFADWRYLTEEQQKGDVLRAFGQVLGLELEHRHLRFDTQQTETLVKEYWEGEIEDIRWNELKKYVFAPLKATDVVMTEEYDQSSIMIWAFPRRYAGNAARFPNYSLSVKDIEFIKKLYPKTEVEPIATIELKSTDQTTLGEATLYVHFTESFAIDFGDGNIQNYPPTTSLTAHGDYFPLKIKLDREIVKIFGKTDALKSLILDMNTTFRVSLDVSQNKNLEDLRINSPFGRGAYSELSLDLSKNTNLKYFSINNTAYPGLNFLKNEKLEGLNMSYSPIASLDISKNVNLKNLFVTNCFLSELNTASNVKLEILQCHRNAIRTLDLSKNTKLISVSCGDNNLTSLTLPDGLETVECNNNDLRELVLPKGLKNIGCYNNPRLTSINTSQSTELLGMSIGNTQLSSLDISKCPKMHTLALPDNKLTSIDVSNNLLLSSIDVKNNPISSFDLSANRELSSITITGTKINSLNISNNPKIYAIYMEYCPLLKDQAALLDFVKSLPLTTGNRTGYLSVSNKAEVYHIIEDICSQKKWRVNYLN